MPAVSTAGLATSADTNIYLGVKIQTLRFIETQLVTTVTPKQWFLQKITESWRFVTLAKYNADESEPVRPANRVLTVHL